MSEGTVLQKLDFNNGRVFEIRKRDQGDFGIEEMCDQYFSVVLTREELIQLSIEIRELADT